MICLLQVDGIVHGDLYNYGLHFSTVWAEPYWTLVKIVFGLGWFNIIAAIGVHLYSVTFRRKEVEQLVIAAEEEILSRKMEQRVRLEEPPILPGVPEEEYVHQAEQEPEQKQEELVASAQS